MFSPKTEKKCWGRVQHIFSSPHAAVSLLDVKAGFKCSTHRHMYRGNLFAVKSGMIVVERWLEGFGTKSTFIELGPGDTVSVPALELHRFRVTASGFVVEVYYPDNGGMVSINDIERLDEGGDDDITELRKEMRGVSDEDGDDW